MQLQQQTCQELGKTSRPHFTDARLACNDICDYIRRAGLRNASFGLSCDQDFVFFTKHCLYKRKMGPKKGRRVRKSHGVLVRGHSSRYTEEEGGEAGKRNGGKGTETERNEVRRVELHTQKRREWQKRTDRSDIEMDTEAPTEDISIALEAQDGAHDKHLPDGLR